MRTAPVATNDLDHPQLLNALDAFKQGDFTVRMPLDHTGIAGKIADTLNEVIDRHERLTKEIRRISTVVGEEGKTSQRAARDGFQGSWGSCIDAVNTLVVDLVQPTSEVARVIGAVAQGDLNQTMALDIDGRSLTGEFLRTAKTINTMVWLNSMPFPPRLRVWRARSAPRASSAARRSWSISELTDSVKGIPRFHIHSVTQLETRRHLRAEER